MNRRVLVIGAGGRMGKTICNAILDDDALELVAAVGPSLGGADLGKLLGRPDTDITVSASLDEVDVDVDVAVDFTIADATRQNMSWCAESSVHAVVGTSGLTVADRVHMAEIFTTSNAVIGPNFAIGAVLMMRFAEMAAPFFETAEVVELHHENKVDAPSGTAIATAERMAAASDDWLADPTTAEVLAGARGAKGAAGIPIHALRLKGVVAHQEVILGTNGQSLTLRHDSYDRACFMPGVVHACKVIHDHPGVTVGLDSYLGI